jgi:hypothetical protein
MLDLGLDEAHPRKLTLGKVSALTVHDHASAIADYAMEIKLGFTQGMPSTPLNGVPVQSGYLQSIHQITSWAQPLFRLASIKVHPYETGA